MSGAFESLKQGLTEAIEFERGRLEGVKVNKVSVTPVRVYTADEVKSIRLQQSMTQNLFAKALGVSVKTVEAWEAGTNRPSGIANRMLEFLTLDNSLFERLSIVARS